MSALLVTGKSPGRSRALKVLVAEDHDDTRFLLRTLLQRRGCTVVEACDGVEAVDLAERERPDLIFMDGGLPLLDGVAATRRLRGMASLSGVPIVFLSGHAGPQAQTAARAAGCDDYVIKPFDLARLEGVLERLLPAGGRGRHRGGDNTMMQTASVREGLKEKTEMAPDGVACQKFFGLVELDPAGTVLYNRFEAEAGASARAALDLTGLNFYTEVARFRNVGEFRQQLDSFSRGSQPALTMDFTCDYEDGPLPVRVLLARIRERSLASATKSVLVHIRRAP